ncbi:MAG: heavy metal sensor histidine kinase [Burkholderiales bacterium]
MSQARAEAENSRAPISLTATLAVLFAAVSVAVLAVTNAFVFFFVEQQWRSSAQKDLEVAGNVLRILVASEAHAESIAGHGDRIAGELGKNRRLTFSIASAKGQPLVSTLAADFPSEAFAGATDIEHPVDWNWQDKHYSVAQISAKFTDGSGASLRLALDVTEPKDIQGAYSRALVLITVAGGMIAAMLGLAVVRKGLLPLHRMATAAGEITASRLGERLRPEDTPPELRDLATGFNGMLERLEDSFRRLNDFSSDIAHELRTPINNLLGQTQVALSRTRSSDEYRSVLESNAEEFERLSRMIQDMLFLAQADNAQAALNPEEVNLRAECVKLIEFFEPLIEEGRLLVNLSGDASVWADRLLLQRALANLVSNAVRNTPPESTIAIKIGVADSGDSSVCICNPGRGIPPEELPRLFDRFYRTSHAREAKTEGTGLGLAIVRSIARLHGGDVHAQSTPGVETRFCLLLPNSRQEG